MPLYVDHDHASDLLGSAENTTDSAAVYEYDVERVDGEFEVTYCALTRIRVGNLHLDKDQAALAVGYDAIARHEGYAEDYLQARLRDGDEMPDDRLTDLIFSVAAE